MIALHSLVAHLGITLPRSLRTTNFSNQDMHRIDSIDSAWFYPSSSTFRIGIWGFLTAEENPDRIL